VRRELSSTGARGGAVRKPVHIVWDARVFSVQRLEHKILCVGIKIPLDVRGESRLARRGPLETLSH
jgi:hypothetical protein